MKASCGSSDSMDSAINAHKATVEPVPAIRHSGHVHGGLRQRPGDWPATLRRGPERQNSLLFALIMESSLDSRLPEADGLVELIARWMGCVN
ncbi:hypothetical protein JCGZ_25472 [Jatropha curcas]|uniref:Uncharacterized protein n=1 Tax=Jatropha curcas TaxID=180498 RepID=A0A067L4N0_JATCU|nr:hypothetical protein JCGZ_25472 [Jatropha curcas]